MARYIDADKLQKDGWKLRREKNTLFSATFETMELDAVDDKYIFELVQCKDCVHCADDWNGNQPMFSCDLFDGMAVLPNEYCSKGETDA